ncbi:MAG: DNA internalization-related competence protein ComEC/Rec2 [Gammaproteobacteria bacterium]|nr:DNA internalization-related competence protein ComEC/Rec2 [Gammaproteobacteria bacterium]
MRLVAMMGVLGSCSLWFISGLDSFARLVGCVLGCVVGLFLLQAWLVIKCQHCQSIAMIARCRHLSLAFLCGLSWSYWQAQQQLQIRMPKLTEAVSVYLIGEVCSIPKYDADRTSWRLCIDAASAVQNCDVNHLPSGAHQVNRMLNSQPFTRGWQHQSRYRFTVPTVAISGAVERLRQVHISWYQPQYKLHQGMRLLLKVKLKTPYAKRNLAAFDYERFALVAGIDATGYVEELQLAPLAEKNAANRLQGTTSWLSHLDSWQARALTQMQSLYSTSQFSAWHQALALGYRAELSSSDQSLLRESGTAHIMAISGLHIGLIFFFTQRLASFIWRRSASLCLRWPAPHIALVCAFTASVVFALLSGFELPAQRALLAIGLFSLQRLCLINWQNSQIFALTLLLLLLFEPLAVLSPGFWLTITALAIIYSQVQPGKAFGIGLWLRLQFLLSAAMGALATIIFGAFPLASFCANLWMVPLVSFVLLPLELLVLILANLCEALASLLLDFSDGLILLSREWLAKLLAFLPAIHSQASGWAWLLLAVLWGAGSIQMAQRLNWLEFILERIKSCPRWRKVSLLSVLILILCSALTNPWWASAPQLNIYTLDSGQGLSILVHYQQPHRDSYGLYDLGYADSNINQTDQLIVPLLHHLGVKKIDWLVVSHNDADHRGDVNSVMAAFPVQRFVRSKAQALSSQGCYEQRWQIDQLQLMAFSSDPVRSKSLSANDQSCLLLLEFNGVRFLFSGDIERAAELELLSNRAADLAADVLWVPHHGSQTSSSWSFIAAVNPKLAIVSSGFLNRFGHPHPSVIERYRAFNVQLETTAETGMLQVQVDASQALRLQRFREVDHHFWNHH